MLFGILIGAHYTTQLANQIYPLFTTNVMAEMFDSSLILNSPESQSQTTLVKHFTVSSEQHMSHRSTFHFHWISVFIGRAPVLLLLAVLHLFQFGIDSVECRTITEPHVYPLPTDSEHDRQWPVPFARTYKLPDGEIVTKLKWHNITAIETRFSHLDLIQIVQHFELIQLYLSNGQLVDCEFTNEPHRVDQIYEEFHKVNPNSRKDPRLFSLIEEYKNLTTLPANLRHLTEFDQLLDQCKEYQRIIKQKLINNNKGKRSRRDSFPKLVFPGTKWCGQGSNSQNFEDLGEYTFADRCCRDHDRCKYSIGPMKSRYHTTNNGIHYLSHCSCDERFRSCLKVANSGAANLVGKLFFNIVKTSCFMFDMEDHCEQWNFWGTECLRMRRRKRAVFRDPMTY